MAKRKIRWGILSTAGIAKQFVSSTGKVSNAEVFAVASRDIEKARRFAKEQGIGQALGSYAELLDDPDIDAVYIPLPTSMHAEWSIRAAEAGKPVLCEKPLALNAAQAMKMAQAFRSRKLAFSEAMMYRFHPMTRKVRQMVDAGAVGDVRSVRATFNAFIEKPTDIRFNKALGGGAMLDLGCYCMSLMRLVTGEEPAVVKTLATFGKKTKVDETIAAVLKFPSGIFGYMLASLTTQFDCSYDVSGSEGRILVDLGGMVAWPGGEFAIKHWRKGREKAKKIIIPPTNHYALMIKDFSDAVLAGRSPSVPIDDSIRNMEAIDRVLAAAGQGI